MVRRRDPVERRGLEVDPAQALGHRGRLLAGPQRRRECVFAHGRTVEPEREERRCDEQTGTFFAVPLARGGESDRDVSLGILPGNPMPHRPGGPGDDLERGGGQSGQRGRTDPCRILRLLIQEIDRFPQGVPGSVPLVPVEVRHPERLEGPRPFDRRRGERQRVPREPLGLFEGELARGLVRGEQCEAERLPAQALDLVGVGTGLG